MGVDVQRGCSVGMSESRRGSADVSSGIDEEGGVEMAQAVNVDPRGGFVNPLCADGGRSGLP